jgi:hypothetical protein
VHAPNHAYTWAMTGTTWIDSQGVQHIMKAYHINSSEKYGVDHEDRGLTTSVFYFDGNIIETAILDRHPHKIPPRGSVLNGKQVWGPVRRGDFSQVRLVLDFEMQSASWEDLAPARKLLSSREKELNAQEFNPAALSFAQSRLGQVVGNGECWTLCHRSFVESGAQGAVKYVFGTEIARGKTGSQDVFVRARIGDVIQFDATRFSVGAGWFQAGAPNHTAIIESISGSVVTVLEQNVPLGGAVQRTTYDFSKVIGGIYVVYRAYPKA